MSAALDHRLLHLLVCPVCKGPLRAGTTDAGQSEALVCPADRLAFPIRDGIPVMLEAEARPLDENEADSSVRPTAA